MVSRDAVFLTNIYVPQLVEHRDFKRRGEVRGGQQQKGFMKDLALIPRRGEQGGQDAQTKSVQDLVMGRGSPDVESVRLHRRSNFPGLFQVLILGSKAGWPCSRSFAHSE